MCQFLSQLHVKSFFPRAHFFQQFSRDGNWTLRGFFMGALLAFGFLQFVDEKSVAGIAQRRSWRFSPAVTQGLENNMTGLGHRVGDWQVSSLSFWEKMVSEYLPRSMDFFPSEFLRVRGNWWFLLVYIFLWKKKHEHRKQQRFWCLFFSYTFVLFSFAWMHVCLCVNFCVWIPILRCLAKRSWWNQQICYCFWSGVWKDSSFFWLFWLRLYQKKKTTNQKKSAEHFWLKSCWLSTAQKKKSLFVCYIILPFRCLGCKMVGFDVRPRLGWRICWKSCFRRIRGFTGPLNPAIRYFERTPKTHNLWFL